MIIEARQSFTLLHPAGEQAALAFVRSPQQSLSAVRFLSELQVQDQMLSGRVKVKAPALGEINLPFRSIVLEQPRGSSLVPEALPHERAWVAVAGEVAVSEEAVMSFQFHFVGHVNLPDVPGWGSAAFEKMVNAAAQRTLSRVAEALPRDIEAALRTPVE